MKFSSRQLSVSLTLVGFALLAGGCGDSGMADMNGGDMTRLSDGDMAQPLSVDLTMEAGADFSITGQGEMFTVADLAVDDAAVGDLAMGDGDGAATDDGTTMGNADGGMADQGANACQGISVSCGPPGNCLDCTSSTQGSACVSASCGCTSSLDCPKGSACDPNSHQCGTACANGLVCNGGCCDGQNCKSGNDNGACGNSGVACVACGSGTPTCNVGACSSGCGVNGNGMGGATCGNGFCCSNGQCAAIGDGSCAVSGAACVDCSKSPNGLVCLKSGSCGCVMPADCAVGQACMGGECGAKCDLNSTCNGGCCGGGSCVAGNVQTACALGNSACGNCAGNGMGSACVVVNDKTFCGCKVAADCPAGMACDPGSNQCTNQCALNQPCHNGCCSSAINGTCQKGIDSGACGGNGGVCAACADPMNPNTNGHVCVILNGVGQCGCNQLSDCPVSSTSCTKGQCVNICGDNMPCQFGCCTAHANGICKNGQGASSCGKSGICADCTKQAGGHVCLPSQSCGCNGGGDCASYESCDLMARACTTSCSMAQPCNGGCCNAGLCALGGAGNACGSANACLDCTMNPTGHACINDAACGCHSAADCGAQQACDPAKHVCTNACNDKQLCNGGCCLGAAKGMDGTCEIGKANTACGVKGSACVGCGNGTPSCVGGACSAECGGPNDGKCAGGNCCSIVNGKGQCVAGNATNHCGYSGNCANCTVNSNGARCETPRSDKWHCGCDDQTDCAAAMGNAAGQACDLTVHTCTDKCGIANVTTICNGGCCGAVNGTYSCRPGSQDGACGNNGGLCNSCQNGCSPGPHCVVGTGTCGCDNEFQCYNNGYFGGACGPMKGGKLGCTSSSVGNPGACCINGGQAANNAADCCTGFATNGVCTCIAIGMAPPGGNPSDCCSLTVGNNGNCIGRPSCLPSGGRCTTANTCFQDLDCASDTCRVIPNTEFKACCDPAGTACGGNNNACCSGDCQGGNCR